MLQVPSITEETLQHFKETWCDSEENRATGLTTLHDIIKYRPQNAAKALEYMLEYTCHEGT